MIDFERLVFLPVFATLGVPGIYTPADGQPIACQILLRRPDRDWQFGGGIGTTSQSTVAEVRTAEVPTAKEGDTLAVGGRTYGVTKASQPDPDRLSWSLELA